MSILFPLMRRDTLWRFIPFAALAGLAPLVLATRSEGIQGGVVGMISSLGIGLLGAARIHERASGFEASLPIDGRDLLRARLCNLMLFLWSPMVIALVVALQFGTQRALSLVWPVGSANMALTAGAVFLQFYRLPRISAGGVPATIANLAVVSIWVAIAAFMRPTPGALLPMASLVLAALAIAVFVRRAWPKEPLALQIVPFELTSAATQANVAAVEPGSWTVLWRSMLNYQTAIWFSFAAVYPLINNFLIPLCFVPAYVTHAYMSLRWTFPLPIRRTRILAVIALPFITCYAASLMINLTWGVGSRASMALDPRPTGVRLASPWWKHVSGDQAPVIQAPWGETHTPEVKRVWLVRSYNPWESGNENSAHFRDWQFRRATLAIFGREIPWKDHEALYKLRPLNRRPVENLLNTAELMVILLLVMSMLFVPRWSRISHLPPAVRKYGAMTILLPLLIFLAASPILAESLGNTGIFDLLAMTWADTVRANAVAAWSTILLVLWLLYTLLEKLFSELEPDNQPAPGRNRSPFGGGLFS